MGSQGRRAWGPITLSTKLFENYDENYDAADTVRKR